MKTRSIFRRWHLGAALAITAVVLAACGSGSTTKTTSQTTTSTSGAATVMVKNGPMGSYLTDGSGRTLYLFVADTTNKSTCTGGCATFWPPLTSTGAPKAGSGADAAKLGTSARSDGSTQVTYNGHPLYYFKDDTAGGDTKGQGVNNFGGLWWMLTPAGDSIQGTAPSPSPSKTGSGGGWA